MAGNANTRKEHGQGGGLERGAHVARSRAYDRATGADVGVAGKRVQEKTHGGQPPLQPGFGERLADDPRLNFASKSTPKQFFFLFYFPKFRKSFSPHTATTAT